MICLTLSGTTENPRGIEMTTIPMEIERIEIGTVKEIEDVTRNAPNMTDTLRMSVGVAIDLVISIAIVHVIGNAKQTSFELIVHYIAGNWKIEIFLVMSIK